MVKNIIDNPNDEKYRVVKQIGKSFIQTSIYPHRFKLIF